MKQLKKKRMLAMTLATAMTAQTFGAGSLPVMAETVGSSQDSYGTNMDFEAGTEGWTTEGDVTVEESNVRQGSKCIRMGKDSKISLLVGDIPQGSYTLTAWVRGVKSSNSAELVVRGTGAPDAVALVDTYLDGDKSVWQQMAHRNVLVYNGQAQIDISAGNSTELYIDQLELTLDSQDENGLSNWGFEDGLTEWSSAGTAEVVTDSADTGKQAIRLAAGSQVEQKVAVEPNTKYALTVRAKVDKQDTFATTKYTDEMERPIGELVDRTSLGDRLNLGVKAADGTVLRQVPSGTEDYSLVTLTFTTGANDSEVTVYANTICDEAYKESVTVWSDYETHLADDWQGNGEDFAYVDNFDLFAFKDQNYIRGADVSFLPLIEDNGGKYFANGVQQDCLRILSNHGVNSLISMVFVHAGNKIYNPDDGLKQIFQDYNIGPDGQPYPYFMQEGYFDKEHLVAVGKRGADLGLSYMPGFQYSDAWISAGKANTPLEWLNVDYEGNLSNSDLDHMKTNVYNYVYDTLTAMRDGGVDIIGVKHGNEQNQGIIWPVGKGSKSKGHAELVAASYEAAEDVLGGVPGFIHTNNGYSPADANSFFGNLLDMGAKMDGAAFSLYGGRGIDNILNMASNSLTNERLKYRDYVNVETGFSFTRYRPTWNAEGSAMGQSSYYRTSGNGQYNWLLDYMQAPFDIPNPHNQLRGFYYWETDWTPTPGAGSSYHESVSVSGRTMFNNGDTGIVEMGSSQPGKAGDMMDSMYAYLMRGCVKEKAASTLSPLRGYGEYTVEAGQVSEISLEQSEIDLMPGDTQRLKVNLAPADKVLTDGAVSYSTSDASVAEVTEKGFVRGVAAGTATVTAEVNGLAASVNVTVGEPKEAAKDDLTLKLGRDSTIDKTPVSDGEEITVQVLSKLQLAAKLPDEVTDKVVIYTSSDPEVASFFGETWQTPRGYMRQQSDKTENVQLNVKKKGTTTITAATQDGKSSLSFTLKAEKVDAGKITLDQTEVTMSNGRKLQLKAALEPEDTTLSKILWESDNPETAAVDKNGLVTAVSVGDAEIRAVSDDNPDVSAVCKVHVVPVMAEGVVLDKETATLQIGHSKTLKALVMPEDTFNKKLTWTSENESVVSVDENGVITGEQIGGPVKVTVTTEDGGFTAECQVTVQEEAVPVTGVSLNQGSYRFASDYFSDTKPLEEIPTVRFSASVEPDMATEEDVVWSSDTPEVAVVNEYGIVTPVSSGVASITATTVDGNHTASAMVYVPAVSESFDNRETGSGWDMTVGSVGGGALGSGVNETDDGKVLQIAGGGSGGRSTQHRFSLEITSDKIILDFEYNVGTSTASNGNYLAVTDSSNHVYLAIQTNKNTELVYSAGEELVNNQPLVNGTVIGQGFDKENTWYHMDIELDMKANMSRFTVTSLDDPSVTATQEAAFGEGIQYNNDLGSIQFMGTRNRDAGNLDWNPALDNFNVYAAGISPRSVVVDTKSVRLLPVKDTLKIQHQLNAKVLPESADQGIVWSSSDETVATVDENGLVKAAKICDNLSDIKNGTCVITAASTADKSILAEVEVEVTNTPNAVERWSISDEKGNEIPFGDEADAIKLQTGDKKKLNVIVSGGDGESDIAGISWTSDDADVVAVDAATGELRAKKAGTAALTVEVSFYSGTPLTLKVNCQVDGEELADTGALEEAVKAGEMAMEYPEDCYTEESLKAYKDALSKARETLETARSERWQAEKQGEIDKITEDLDQAVQGLAIRDNIPAESIILGGGDNPLSINKKTTLKAELKPAYATETLTWTSSNPEVAAVDESGVVTPLSEGTATIRAEASSGASAEKKITVTKDLTSWFQDNGVTISSVGTGSKYKDTTPFINARTSSIVDAWSTGSNTNMGSLTVDFKTRTSLESLTTSFWQQMKYKVETSDDGITWNMTMDHSGEFAGAIGNEVFTEAFPENTSARFVRVTTLGVKTSTDWVGISIMRVDGAFEPEAQRTLDSLELTSGPDKTVYDHGEELDLTGLTLTAGYDNGDSRVLKAQEYRIEGYDSSLLGNQTVTVAYTEGDVTLKCEFEVTVRMPVTTTRLEKAIAFAEGLKAQQEAEQGFTEASWADVEAALAEASAVLADENVSQEEIDGAALTLIGVCSALVEKIPKVGLKTAIDEAEKVLADEEALAGYTEESVENVRLALTNAQTVYEDETAEQEAVNTALKSLMDAVTSLLRIDNSRLDALIQKAEEILTDADSYTSGSVDALQKALEEAKAVAGNKNATEEEINAAYDKLFDALISMAKRGNKAELEVALAKANEILAQRNRYVASTVSDLEAATAEAQTVYDNIDATQKEINGAVETLVPVIMKARLLGDVNMNGIVESDDAAEILKYTAELQELTEEQVETGDVNRDGEADATDSAVILQYTAEKISEF